MRYEFLQIMTFAMVVLQHNDCSFAGSTAILCHVTVWKMICTKKQKEPRNAATSAQPVLQFLDTTNSNHGRGKVKN